MMPYFQRASEEIAHQCLRLSDVGLSNELPDYTAKYLDERALAVEAIEALEQLKHVR